MLGRAEDALLAEVTVAAAVADHFGAHADIRLVPEIVLTNPRASFDYVAFRKTDTGLDDIIAIGLFRQLESHLTQTRAFTNHHCGDVPDSNGGAIS